MPLHLAQPRLVLTLSCRDRRGIVAAVAGFLCEQGCNILESAQFEEPLSESFFMRVVFHGGNGAALVSLEQGFAPIGERFAMKWEMFDLGRRPRALIAVSRFGHCLNDLLYRFKAGSLPIDIPAIVSNQPDMEPLARANGIPYVHIPVSGESKIEAEAKLLSLFEGNGCDFLVLARYMQILSDGLCDALSGRIINIHHSFLPSFKGAKPYHQAHARGVKLVGATAHYVTADLDEGPIIEQEVIRVSHAKSAEDLVAVGRDVESIVLARAVSWHAEHRVLINGNRTIVFN